MGDRLGREAVVASHHRDLDASPMAGPDRLRHTLPRGVVEADQAKKDEVLLHRSAGQGRLGRHGQHPVALASHGIVGRHHLGPLGVAQGHGAPARLGAQPPAIAALEHLQGGALGDRQLG